MVREIKAPGVAPQLAIDIEYDDDGSVIGRTDASGISMEHRYDAWGNEIEVEKLNSSPRHGAPAGVTARLVTNTP